MYKLEWRLEWLEDAARSDEYMLYNMQTSWQARNRQWNN